jgi:hypothetical protein
MKITIVAILINCYIEKIPFREIRLIEHYRGQTRAIAEVVEEAEAGEEVAGEEDAGEEYGGEEGYEDSVTGAALLMACRKSPSARNATSKPSSRTRWTARPR